MHAQRRLSLNFAAGLLSETLNKVYPFIVIKLATQRLGVNGFGFAQFGMGFMEMLIPMVVWGYQTYGTIVVGQQSGDIAAQKETIANVFFLKLVHATLLALGMNLLASMMPSYAEYRILFLSLSFVLFTSAIDMIWLNVAQQKLASVSIFVFLARTLSFLLIYVFVQTPKDATLFAVLNMTSNGLISLFTLAYAWDWLDLRRITFASLRQTFRLSPRFALIFVIYSIIDRLDLVMTEHMFGTQAVGLYAGPLRINNSLSQIVGAMLLPLFAELVILKEKDAITRTAAIGVEVLCLTIFPIIAGLYFVRSDVIALILGPEFIQANHIFLIQACALIPFALMHLFGNQILLTFGKGHSSTIIPLIGGVLCSICIVGGGKLGGLEGLAWGALLGKLIMAIMIVVATRHIIHRLSPKIVVVPLMATCIMILALALAPRHSLFVLAPLGIGVYLAICIILYRGRLRTLIPRRTKES